MKVPRLQASDPVETADQPESGPGHSLHRLMSHTDTEAYRASPKVELIPSLTLLQRKDGFMCPPKLQPIETQACFGGEKGILNKLIFFAINFQQFCDTNEVQLIFLEYNFHFIIYFPETILNEGF